MFTLLTTSWFAVRSTEARCTIAFILLLVIHRATRTSILARRCLTRTLQRNRERFSSRRNHLFMRNDWYNFTQLCLRSRAFIVENLIAA